MATQENLLCVAHGDVKVTGFSQRTSWKTGGIQIFQDHNDRYHCRMVYIAGYPKTFPLSNNVKRNCSYVGSNPGRCVIHLKDNSNLTIQKARTQDVAKVIQMVNSLKDCKRPLEESSKLPLTCSVCLEDFNVPKVLPCGHTFCKPCVGRVAEENRLPRSEGGLKCPTCRTVFVLPTSGSVDDLPTNYEVLNIIDKQGQGRHAGTDGAGPSQGTTGTRRQPECQLHNSARREFYCMTCSAAVCSECLLDNHKPQEHNITTKAELLKNALEKLGQLDRMCDDIQQRQHDVEVSVLSSLADCQNEKARLERQIETARHREMERIKGDAEKMLEKVRKETADRTDTFTGVQQTTKRMRPLPEKRKRRIAELTEELNAGNLTHVDEVEDMGEDLEHLQQNVESTEETVHSTPTKIQPLKIQFSYDSTYTFRN